MAESRIPCRACAKPLPPGGSAKNPFFPFCSAACRYKDLGDWVDGKHRIPGGPAPAPPEPPAGE